MPFTAVAGAGIAFYYAIPRLQTGMRGAFGKPQGTVARVDIGQIIMSVRTKDNHKASAVEAFRRAKFKFPGRQKVRLVAEVLEANDWCCDCRFLCQTSGGSPSGTERITKRCVEMAD